MRAKRSKKGPDDEDPETTEAPVVDSDELDVEELVRERDRYLSSWQRAQADFKNLKRRTLSDIDAAVRRSQQGLLDGILVAIDHLEMALASPTESDDARNLAQGVQLTRDQILRALEQEGVHVIADTKAFDPSLHEAVRTVESDELEPGSIAETLRRGYTWGDVVLRPAHVSVVAGEPAPGQKENAPPAEEEG